VSSREQAAVIAASVRAQLAVAFERGECTLDNLDTIARTLGNAAAQALAIAEEAR